MSVKRFTASLKSDAWERLQANIQEQLLVTPGEYDVFSLADRVARNLQYEYGQNYNKVVEYLEERYKAEEG